MIAPETSQNVADRFSNENDYIGSIDERIGMAGKPNSSESQVRDHRVNPVKGPSESNPFWETLSDFRIQDGTDLLELTHNQPVLLIFLRHLGCTFCRETLADVASRQTNLREKGIQPVFVHMAQESEDIHRLFSKYGLEDCPRISDRQKVLYETFGLKRGTLRQVLGPKVMWRGFMAAILRGHGFGLPEGDPFQLPGVFLVHRGRILKDFRHELSSDVPPYSEFEPCEGC